MTDEEQRKVFAKNLNYYIAQSGKQQKEVAKDLGFHATTFNTWCVGKILPKMGKVQKIADYFGIGKSDLIDVHIESPRQGSPDQSVLDLYHRLDSTDQAKVVERMEVLLEADKYAKGKESQAG